MELNLCRVIFEGDTNAVIQTIRSKEESLQWFSQLAEDAKSTFRDRPLWQIQHVYRESNIRVSHQLAKLAIDYNEE